MPRVDAIAAAVGGETAEEAWICEARELEGADWRETVSNVMAFQSTDVGESEWKRRQKRRVQERVTSDLNTMAIYIRQAGSGSEFRQEAIPLPLLDSRTNAISCCRIFGGCLLSTTTTSALAARASYDLASRNDLHCFDLSDLRDALAHSPTTLHLRTCAHDQKPRDLCLC
jgi:hypothetical protein